MAGSKHAVVHPAFSSKLLSIRQPLSGTAGPDLPNTTIQRGYIRQAQPFPGYASGTAGQHVFHFLYNPSTVGAGYTVQQTGMALSYLYANPADAASISAPVNGSVQFTVLFDRTYELWKSYNTDGTAINAGSAQMVAAGNDPTVVGCMADIIQIARLTGMYETGSQVKVIGGGSDTFTNQEQNSFNTSQGFMMMVPCWTYFGPSNGALAVYGYISSWDYTITHWSQYMVPMRCAIDINIQILPAPLNGNGLGWSLGSATSNQQQTVKNTFHPHNGQGVPGV